MKTSILNIGLAREGHSDLNSAFVLELLEQTLPSGLLDFKVCRSDTEKTVVAKVASNDVPNTFLEGLAVVLGQDCIAALDDGKVGRLVGPRAEAWAPFQPSQFLTLSGNPL